jgi:HSP20 family molecular chaperone IbpA
MRTTRLELMREHVRAIHRTVSGSELDESAADPTGGAPDFDEVTRRFAELEALTRSIPSLAERVPPFSFTPPVDVFGTERELVLELGVPGVERGDVEVEVADSDLTVSGVRPATPSHKSRIYFHAEMASGPFRRIVRLPEPITGAPLIAVENGVIRIRLNRAAKSPLPRA